MASTPIARARDATLPPLLGTGSTVPVHLVVTDTAVEFASGVTYNAWTFGGTVPGPIIHVRQGQTVEVTLTNNGIMPHSVDFHVIGAIFADVYPDGAAEHALTGVSVYPVAPGEGVVFDLVIPQPGKYPFVDHSMRDTQIGAVGTLDVEP